MKNFWQNLDINKQTMILIILTIAAILLLFSRITLPLMRSSYNNIDQYISIKEQMAESPQWVRITEKLQQQNKQMLQVLQRAQESMQGIQKDSGIIALLHHAASANRVNIEMLKPVQNKQTNKIEVMASGQYHNLGRFIYDIEKNRTLIWVDAFNLGADEKRNGTIHAMIHFAFQQKENLYDKSEQ